MTDLKVVEGGVLAAEGFVAAAMNCGVKAEALDLVMIHSLTPAAAAATVTQNRFRAAPTYVTQQAVADGRAQTIVANSGNANCATGDQGLADARRMAELAAQASGAAAGDVIVCSTGHIGDPMPMDKLEAGIPRLGGLLSRDDPEKIARGIMTTDSHPKSCAVEFDRGGVTCRLGGIAKGAGMICPNMATMLCFVTTDAAVDAGLLRATLLDCVEHSFNCISVDGDMSTNDTVAVLANGAAGNAALTSESDPDYPTFKAALARVTRELAKQIAFDGEEATKAVTLHVTGAASFEQAREMGKAVANYTLFRAMLYGADFNWGRVAAAMGASLLDFDPRHATIKLQGITAWDQGQPQAFDLQKARALLQPREVLVEMSLGVGDAEAMIWTCDLTPGYVTYNAEYESAEPEDAA